jgi:hypothetical protein
MAVYRFKIAFEDYDDVVRCIEIKANQTFEDLQQAYHASIGFDLLKQSSFYMSDDNWKKGKEITSREIAEGDASGARPIKTARFSEYISDPHQKIYYVYDPEAQWGFHIELIKIIVADEAGAKYPRCIKTNGEAPKQYGSTVLGAVPEPEDFDEEAVHLMVDEEDLPEGTADSDEPIDVDGVSNDELETADSDEMEDESPASDDFT